MKTNVDVLEFGAVPGGALQLVDTARGERLFVLPDSRLLLPDFARDAALLSKTPLEGGAMRLEFAGGALARGVVAVEPHRRAPSRGNDLRPRRRIRSLRQTAATGG